MTMIRKAVVGAVLVAGAMAGSPSFAQTTEPNTKLVALTPSSSTSTGFFVAPAKLTDSEVEAFVVAPESILTEYSQNRLTLSNRVRSLVGSDQRTLDPVFGLVQKAMAYKALVATAKLEGTPAPEVQSVATDDQVAAIGSGLGRAAFALSRINPDYAARIQSKIADMNSPELLTAFLAASNDIQVAALGATGATGGGAPGIAGGGLAGPGAGTPGADSTVANTPGTFPQRSASTVTDSGSRGNTTNFFITTTSVSRSAN